MKALGLLCAAAVLAALTAAPAFAQGELEETRDVLMRVKFDCFFEPDRELSSSAQRVSKPRPTRSQAYDFFFAPPCDGRGDEATLEDVDFHRVFRSGDQIFPPATFVDIGASGCSDPSCPGSLKVTATLRNDVPGVDLALEQYGPGQLSVNDGDINPQPGQEPLRFTNFEQLSAVGVDARVDMRARIANRGPESVPGVELRMALPAGVDPGSVAYYEFDGFLPDRMNCRQEGRRVVCPLPEPLDNGRRVTVYLPIVPERTGDELLTTARVVAEEVPDPTPQNNERAAELTVTQSPDSRAESLPDGAEGSATGFQSSPGRDQGAFTEEVMRAFPAASSLINRLSRIRRVEVAVLRRQPDGDRCHWLVDDSPRFKSTPEVGGDCDDARWLRARGTGSWSFKLDRRWPAGSYTLFSRAVNRAGAREGHFSRRDRNLVRFTIQR